MSPPDFTTGLQCTVPCPLCGFLMVGFQDARKLFANLEQNTMPSSADWRFLGEIRAFRAREPFLSGVGCISHRPSTIRGCAPFDPSKRFYDEDYYEHADDHFQIRSLFATFSRAEPLDVGYPVHQSCWLLLRRWARVRGVKNFPDSRPLSFLYRLHHSTLDGMGYDWAGDYGGLFDMSGQLSASAVHCATFDPFYINPIIELVEKAQALVSVPMAQQRPIFAQKRESRLSKSDGLPDSHIVSPLRLLPAEVLVMIIEQLATPDLLSFWLAYSEVPDFLPSRFWRSRFNDGMEFGHLFEVTRLWHVPNIDWYTLFWQVRGLLSSNAGFHIRNRRRVLLVINRILDLVLTYADRPPEGIDDHPFHPILLETDGLSSHQKSMPLPRPPQIEAIHISTVQLNDRQYVSGLRVNDSASGLGYCHECTSNTFRIDVAVHGRACEIGCFMDRFGVRGLYIITESGWTCGVTFEAEAAESLSQGVLPLGEELIGYFDVFLNSSFFLPSNLWTLFVEEVADHPGIQAIKLTAIGVNCPLTVARFTRSDLLWQCCLPPEDITIDLKNRFYSDLRSKGLPPWCVKYNPLQYHLFDDDRDQLYRDRDSLVQITGYVSDLWHNLVGIQFIYQEKGNNSQHTVFIGSQNGRAFHFSIDGPRGEYITEARVAAPRAVVAPIITLRTNYERSCSFSRIENSPCIKENDKEWSYTPKAGEYIAGFMWAPGGLPNLHFRNRLESFWNFGIICRPLPALPTGALS